MNIYYVAAKETMQAGFATFLVRRRDFSRTDLRAKGVDVKEKKRYQSKRYREYQNCLADGWVTFPQGTTKSLSPFAREQRIL
jgi:hypothetical protein